MAGEDIVMQLLLALGELERRELLQEAELAASVPPPLLEDFRSYDVTRDWIRSHHHRIMPALLRMIDIDDDTITSLVRSGYLAVGEGRQIDIIGVAFSFVGGYQPDQARQTPDMRLAQSELQNAVALTDLTAASCAMCELFIATAAANRPFGVVLEPPLVEVTTGSVTFAIGGTLFASGISLLVACSAGMVAAPVVGPLAGAVLATAGALDLALGWKKIIAENKKLSAEKDKMLAEAHKLLAEARKNDAEARKAYIESQAKVLELQRGGALPPSSVVPQPVVRAHCQRLGLSEGYANHVLNRALPTYIALRQYCDVYEPR